MLHSAFQHFADDIAAGALLPPELTRYPGGKNGAGVFQTIINEIPPHRCYIEAFAGSAAVFRRKRPADTNILIDSNVAVCLALEAASRKAASVAVTVLRGDARSLIAGLPEASDRQTLIYADPPYLPDTRVKKRIYPDELDKAGHAKLLELLLSLPCMVMISGYRSTMYDAALSHWRRVDYRAGTRGGPRIESLWLNFPRPAMLHDYRFIGRNFREREKWKRRMTTLRNRLARMPELERGAVLAELAGILAPFYARVDAAGAPIVESRDECLRAENGEPRAASECARAFL